MISRLHKFFLLSFITSQTVASCASLTSEMVDITPTSVSLDTPVPLVVSTSTATSSATSPPPIVMPKVKTQCIDSQQENVALDLEGIIVLEKTAHQLNSPLGFDLFDANTKRIIGTNDKGIVTIVSPNKKYVAYTYDTWDSHFIQIMDSDGKIVADFADFTAYSNGVFEAYFNWQSTRQIRIIEENGGFNIYPYLFNPFTQERTSLETDWNGYYQPDIPDPSKVADWKFDSKATSLGYVYGANILYDPTLTRVLYPQDDGVVSLVDTQSETELARANLTDWGRLPSWSPDGEYLAIVNHKGNSDEFYLINRNGSEFERISDFSNEFDFTSILDYTWSPDSSQIAFWLELDQNDVEDGPQSELAILDILTRQATRLCIQGISNNAYEPWAMNHPEPIWSPDGEYIIITQWDDPAAPQNYSVLVIDSLTGAMEKISDNTAPIGWMVNEP